MGFDLLRVVQVMWAIGDVLLTGGAFALLGIYGGDGDRNCRRGGLVLWALCGVAPMVLYAAGYLITFLSRQLDARHPANWKLLTMLAAANNIVIGQLYQHRVTPCGEPFTKVLLAVFGAMPVWGALIKQLVKGSCGPKRSLGPEAYQQQDFAPHGPVAASKTAAGRESSYRINSRF